MRMITSNRATAPGCLISVTVSAEGSRLCFNFWVKSAFGGSSRNVREECPAHVLAEVKGFISSGAAAPLLDYLAERGELHPALAAAVVTATDEYNRPSYYQTAAA